ncbi:hypothetical protein EV177_010698, partial [Coemansia sp. RSA 1804]
INIKFPEKGWTPSLELKRLLPSTYSSNDISASSGDADIVVLAARAITAGDFESRTRQRDSTRRQYYDEDEEDY